MNRSRYGLAALGASAMLRAGCTAPGGDEGDGSDEPYKFAIVYGVSGFLAGYAPTYFSGVDAAVLGTLMREQGIETLGVIVGGDAEGDAYLAGIEAVADENDIEIIHVERPNPAALNFSVGTSVSWRPARTQCSPTSHPSTRVPDCSRRA